MIHVILFYPYIISSNPQRNKHNASYKHLPCKTKKKKKKKKNPGRTLTKQINYQ